MISVNYRILILPLTSAGPIGRLLGSIEYTVLVYTFIMKETIRKKDLHVRINIDLYEKLRQISFYEHRTITEVISRLIAEYVEEKAIDGLDLTMPMLL